MDQIQRLTIDATGEQSVKIKDILEDLLADPLLKDTASVASTRRNASFAGVIAAARAAGRRAVVAVVPNGDAVP